ncbi:MAG TPA: acyloxyacyl hydrolase [Terracidiphilus sp.]|nr:acyloxyacyl hydrolase [Terracidiphilus sp.]
MLINLVCPALRALPRRVLTLAEKLHLDCPSILTALCFVGLQPAHAQTNPVKAFPESEIAIEGGGSFGNYHLFAYAEDRRVYTSGIEYDRHSWGGFLNARVDYVAEILPVVLLSEPAQYKYDSTALTTAHQLKYGADISPIGVRLLWRRNNAFKPYLISKGGVAYFKERVMSPGDTHLQFVAQFGGGMEQTLARRLELRAGISEFHISNGNISASNPGVDLIYVYSALSYKFGR